MFLNQAFSPKYNPTTRIMLHTYICRFEYKLERFLMQYAPTVLHMHATYVCMHAFFYAWCRVDQVFVIPLMSARSSLRRGKAEAPNGEFNEEKCNLFNVHCTICMYTNTSAYASVYAFPQTDSDELNTCTGSRLDFCPMQQKNQCDPNARYARKFLVFFQQAKGY